MQARNYHWNTSCCERAQVRMLAPMFTAHQLAHGTFMHVFKHADNSQKLEQQQGMQGGRGPTPPRTRRATHRFTNDVRSSNGTVHHTTSTTPEQFQ